MPQMPYMPPTIARWTNTTLDALDHEGPSAPHQPLPRCLCVRHDTKGRLRAARQRQAGVSRRVGRVDFDGGLERRDRRG